MIFPRFLGQYDVDSSEYLASGSLHTTNQAYTKPANHEYRGQNLLEDVLHRICVAPALR